MVGSRRRENKRLQIEQERLLKQTGRRNISRIIAERDDGYIDIAGTDGSAPLRFRVKLGVVEDLDAQLSRPSPPRWSF